MSKDILTVHVLLEGRRVRIQIQWPALKKMAAHKNRVLKRVKCDWNAREVYVKCGWSARQVPMNSKSVYCIDCRNRSVLTYMFRRTVTTAISCLRIVHVQTYNMGCSRDSDNGKDPHNREMACENSERSRHDERGRVPLTVISPPILSRCSPILGTHPEHLEQDRPTSGASVDTVPGQCRWCERGVRHVRGRLPFNPWTLQRIRAHSFQNDKDLLFSARSLINLLWYRLLTHHKE